MRTRSLLALPLALAACRYHPEPVPMAGTPADLQRIAGHWEGEYVGRESQRIGIITFDITAEADSAFGSVLLTANDPERPLRHADPSALHLRHATSDQLLHITFVAVSGSRIRGELEAYIAPDCACVAHTTFTGRLDGDRISGTFVTRRQSGPDQGGSWRLVAIRRP